MSSHPKEFDTLGARLGAARENFGFKVEDIARMVQAAPRYIRALEGDDYEVFPAKVYALGFLKKVLKILEFKENDELLKEFSNEWDVRTFRRRKEITPLPENRGETPFLTSGRILLGMGVVACTTFLIFAGARLIRFLDTPRLYLQEPSDGVVLEEPVIQIKGKAEKESMLTVNGREITIDDAGNFDEKLELAAGVNALEFVVQDRFGKITQEVRHVLVK